MIFVMAMSVRDVVELLYRFLRKEQRELPLMDPDLDDPLPEALAAMNATLQRLAVRSPKFAAQKPMAVMFHAPAKVTVTGLQKGEKTVTCVSWPEWAAGCEVMLPGDAKPNRLVAVTGQVAELLYPHMSETESGQAEVRCDCARLPEDVLTVLPPVRWRGGRELLPANGRRSLAGSGERESGDFGRRGKVERRVTGEYVVDGVQAADGGAPVLELRLAAPVKEDAVLECDARCSLGWLSPNEVFNETPLPVPGGYVESLFVPLALMRFFGSSVMRNTDVPSYVKAQADEAELLLQGMRPQAEKGFRVFPGI